MGITVAASADVSDAASIGEGSQIWHLAQVREQAVLGDQCIVGRGAVLTNDSYPRAVTPDGGLKSASDWHAVGVTVGDGASIGARAVCVAPVTIGRWAMVAAGAVVTRDVPDHALVAGVPARRIGWVGRAGQRLVRGDGEARWVCPVTGERYDEVSGTTLTKVE